jgi:hypothetical protein
MNLSKEVLFSSTLSNFQNSLGTIFNLALPFIVKGFNKKEAIKPLFFYWFYSVSSSSSTGGAIGVGLDILLAVVDSLFIDPVKPHHVASCKTYLYVVPACRSCGELGVKIKLGLCLRQ